MEMQNSASPAINKSPLNKSQSKACFSFAKGPRDIKDHLLKYRFFNISDMIYDIPSMMDKRSTSIGYGKKVTLGPLNNYPSPDKY